MAQSWSRAGAGSALRRELRTLFALAAPVVAAQVGSMLIGTVDTLMVGRVGVDALAAAAIANAWLFALLLFGQGIVHGIDPLVSQAHGAGDGARAALALQRGVVLALGASVPLCVLAAFTEEVLRLAGQEPRLAREAGRYALVQVPSLPCFLVFIALRQYLQGREIVRPAMWVIGVGNLFNALFNYVLIFGKLGIPALGLLGAGIASTLTRALLLAGLLWCARSLRLFDAAWVPWSRRSVDAASLSRVLALGFPIAIQMSLEIWAFSTATLLAGRLGAAALAAHTIALNLASMSFMMALGVSQGAVTRVGNLLGAARPDDAQRSAGIALVLGAGVMSGAALAFVLGRQALPRLYTPDAAAVALCASILPIAAAFQIFDGLQAVACGILRGMGRTRPAAWFNLLGYWVLGLPLAAWLAFFADRGLPGIWWGLCLGLAVVAGSLVTWVQVRGPARATALLP